VKSTIPENTARFSLEEIARVTGGLLSGSSEGAAAVAGVTTDTRGAIAGKLFVALSGERFDGHAFASHAVRGGARALLAERDLGEIGVPVVRVGSTLAALAALAAHHRRRWAGRLAAVAGSAGKTTTRSAIGAALEAVAPGAVHSAPGNLNNAIGVPLVLLALEPRHRCAVVEIGTNARGEVRQLTRAATPDVGVLTVIGLEHTQGLGTLDDVETEEGSLFQALDSGAVALGNADDPRVVRQMARAGASRKCAYGFAEGADYRILDRAPAELGPARIRLARPTRPELVVDWPLLGRPGAYALAAGVAAAELLTGGEVVAGELQSASARAGIGEPGRLVPIRLGNGAVLLDDTYNSNPASLASSVEAAAELARARGRRLVLVLGEMRELGDDSPRLHRESGEELVEFGAARVVAVSGDARWLLEPFERARVTTDFVADAEQAARLLVDGISPDDVVLVKASRGVRAERIVEALLRHYGRAG